MLTSRLGGFTRRRRRGKLAATLICLLGKGDRRMRVRWVGLRVSDKTGGAKRSVGLERRRWL
jgi:hypothetical protein